MVLPTPGTPARSMINDLVGLDLLCKSGVVLGNEFNGMLSLVTAMSLLEMNFNQGASVMFDQG